jgi:hypothetical protein
VNTPRELQASAERKAEWLADAQKRLPIGTRVQVVRSDVPGYVGVLGTVRDYNVGEIGDWPMISVAMDTGKRDGFYGDGDADDEIVRVEDAVPAAACPRCGGWTNCGGMAQFSKATTPQHGRVGCTCNAAVTP